MKTLIFFSFLILFSSSVWAAGLSKAHVIEGRRLFYSKELVGEEGKTCAKCHEGGAQFRFNRRSIKDKEHILSKFINICLEKPDRSNFHAFEGNDVRLRFLIEFIFYDLELERIGEK